MSKIPLIKPEDWIYVGKVHCVVATLRDNGECEVVFNNQKPTNRDARWNGTAWEFSPSVDFGGYADKYPRLRKYVQILKDGPFA